MKESHRQNIAIGQRKAHAEGRHPGWAHKNQDLTRSSYPERWMREAIKNDTFLKEQKVIEQLHITKYFLDFAFTEFMVDLEIDGEQHKRMPQSTKDVIRDEYMIQHGWKVYRVEWAALFANPKDELYKFVSFLKNQYRRSYTKVCLNKPKKLSGAEKRQIIANERMQTLISAGINFSRYGWVQESADLIGIPPQKINLWMKRYFPEKLENSFQRKRVITIDTCCLEDSMELVV